MELKSGKFRLTKDQLTEASVHLPNSPKIWTTFVVLVVPCTLFLLVAAGFAVYYGSQGAGPQQIVECTQAAASWILVAVQLLLLGFVALLSWSGDEIDWSLPSSRRGGVELAVGATCGIGLGVTYVFGLAPALTWVQRSLGDYVPPGSVFPAVGQSLWPFFIADVLLAPFVEESIYRGWATNRLLLRFGLLPTVLIVCGSFGLLHWAGGLWYVLLVGFVAGELFISLRLLRNNLVAPFAAHFGLNVVEYLFVWLRH